MIQRHDPPCTDPQCCKPDYSKYPLSFETRQTKALESIAVSLAEISKDLKRVAYPIIESYGTQTKDDDC